MLRRLLPVLWFIPLVVVCALVAIVVGALGYPVGE